MLLNNSTSEGSEKKIYTDKRNGVKQKDQMLRLTAGITHRFGRIDTVLRRLKMLRNAISIACQT